MQNCSELLRKAGIKWKKTLILLDYLWRKWVTLRFSVVNSEKFKFDLLSVSFQNCPLQNKNKNKI